MVGSATTPQPMSWALSANLYQESLSSGRGPGAHRLHREPSPGLVPYTILHGPPRALISVPHAELGGLDKTLVGFLFLASSLPLSHFLPLPLPQTCHIS